MSLFFILYLLFLTFVAGVIFLLYGRKTYTQIVSQVYQKRKSSNPSGGFRFKETRRINQQII